MNSNNPCRASSSERSRPGTRRTFSQRLCLTRSMKIDQSYNASTESLQSGIQRLEDFEVPNMSLTPRERETFPFYPSPSPSPSHFSPPNPFFAKHPRPGSGYSTAADQSGDESPLTRFTSNQGNAVVPILKGPHAPVKDRGGSGDSLIGPRHAGDSLLMSDNQGKSLHYLNANYESRSPTPESRLRRSTSTAVHVREPQMLGSFTLTTGLRQATNIGRQRSLNSICRTGNKEEELDAVFRAIETSDARKRRNILEGHLDKIFKITPRSPSIQPVGAERRVQVVEGRTRVAGQKGDVEHVKRWMRFREKAKIGLQDAREKAKRKFGFVEERRGRERARRNWDC